MKELNGNYSAVCLFFLCNVPLRYLSLKCWRTVWSDQVLFFLVGLVPRSLPCTSELGNHNMDECPHLFIVTVGASMASIKSDFGGMSG